MRRYGVIHIFRQKLSTMFIIMWISIKVIHIVIHTVFIVFIMV